MKIYINDNPREVDDSRNLLQIMSGMQQPDTVNMKGIAIAVNDQVITRDQWEKFYPVENSRIIIITATQGG